MKKIIEKITNTIRRLLGLDRNRSSNRQPDGQPSARGQANAALIIQRIRNATHPQYRDRPGRTAYAIPAERREHGMWVIASPWHGGRPIGGYYIRNRRQCYSVSSPSNPADYDDRVEQHEIAHDIEAELGIAPPWHYRLWQAFIYHWWDYPGILAVSRRHVAARHLLALPGVRPGDEVEIDFADGTHTAFLAPPPEQAHA